MVAALLEERVGGETPGIAADVGFGGLRCLWWAGNSGDFPAYNEAAGDAEDTMAIEAIQRIRSRAAKLGGWVVVEGCPLPMKQRIDVWGDTFDGMEIMRRIKRQFDPQGILNPGRFVGRL